MDTMTLSLEKLESSGYVTMKYPPALRAGVRSAMRAWRAFCSLDTDVKSRIGYSGDVNVSGNGYELKLESDFDRKEDFHVRVSARHSLVGEAARAGHVAEEFVEAALDLNRLVRPLVREFAEAAQMQFGMRGLLDDVIAKEPEALIRFLHYFGDREPGDQLASQHVDKGGFTLHLYESDPGLEYLSMDGEWRPMQFSLEETAIIPGMRMQLRSENKLKATCHRVVSNEKTARAGRYSAVVFVDFAKTPYYDKTRLGRTQNYAEGFNYTMPFSEFETMFKTV
jgi:isopenicillin N synthase-like dioxygenase